jgi:hypothetical protein
MNAVKAKKELGHNMAHTQGKPLTKEELSNLTMEQKENLIKCNLPNSDDFTDNDEWGRNGVKGAFDFIENQDKVFNLLLGKSI